MRDDFTTYSISQEICTRFLLCCALLWLYIDWFSHIHMIAPVPAKQPWWIWINTSCEFIMNDCITTTKQSTTKPCAYFLGYTVVVSHWLGAAQTDPCRQRSGHKGMDLTLNRDRYCYVLFMVQCLNISFVMNYRWIFRSMINTAIDLIISKHRYITAVLRSKFAYIPTASRVLRMHGTVPDQHDFNTPKIPEPTGQNVGLWAEDRCTAMRNKVCNISRTLVGNKIFVDSDVIGASPVGAAPTTSSFST